MALGNPIDAWIQMAQNRNQNRNQMYGNIAGIGQGLGGAMGSIGQMMQQQQQKKALQGILNTLQNNAQGNSAFGGTMGGTQNPMYSAASGMSAPVTGMGGPLGMLGQGDGTTNGWSYVGPLQGQAIGGQMTGPGLG